MNLNYFHQHNIEDIYKNIQEIYLRDNSPWIIGYSGGKDSSTTTQLIFRAVHQLKKEGKKLHKPIYIISADTLVENPMIINFITDTLNMIEKKARKLGLPIKTQKVYPKYDETFWSLMIGKGYPSPRQKFRWCTDRLKIKPTTNFIKDKLSKYNEAIVVLGVRKGESASRDQVLNNSQIEGKTLRRHQSLNNAYIYAPIEEFSVSDVWHFLLNHYDSKSPWDTDNYKLYKLYNDSNAECPMVISKDTKACGNSRFGCWTCTVVKEDKSLTGFIKSGQKWLRPLLEFRNWLYNIRSDRSMREKKRSNGIIYTIERDGKSLRGLGPFNLKARREILRKLLEIQKEIKNKIDYNLIQKEELKIIRQKWISSGDWEDSLPKIYKEINGEPLSWEIDQNYLFDSKESKLLTELCRKEEIDPELLQKLISIEADYLGYNYRHNIYKKIKKLLKQDWLHYEDIKDLGSDVNGNQ
ncbi:DNA phosphorothioation system sulfurtransferase DndC [Natroniella sulfidigena]|uniref:DNA phosphorothioation system sulfurtransferase DndC n=1 Tax=Natroniella sulfidigena TaxID=723921 RepID=UPI00200B2F8B|nr:DNA phosphorothioation system sulfurtransferase DndC [Natroniella sulfidigena]MCK8817158.1 DNA phosphorothioation system sulfurtransferase DndC [Natroniella sulfidigena]